MHHHHILTNSHTQHTAQRLIIYSILSRYMQKKRKMRHRLPLRPRARNIQNVREKHYCAYKDNFDILPNVECEIFTLSSLLNGHKFQANIIISTGWFYSNSHAQLRRSGKVFALINIPYHPARARLIQLLLLWLRRVHTCEFELYWTHSLS